MPRLTLVRHGRAAAGWGDDLDPGLDDLGRAQAESVAKLHARRVAAVLAANPQFNIRSCLAAEVARHFH